MDRLFLLSKADLLAGSGDLAKWRRNRLLAVATALRLAGAALPLDGREIMEILGIDEGPLVGEALSALTDEIAKKGPLDAAAAKDFLRRRFRENEKT